jgi:mono/diheme cytochrome c family protein
MILSLYQRLVAGTLLTACSAILATSAQTQIPAAVSTFPAGAEQYATRCAACHGATLDGLDHAPSLRGRRFLDNWNGETQRKLYSRIISTMPVSDPGSLEPKDVLAITQYILSVNEVETAPAASPSELDKRTIKGR